MSDEERKEKREERGEVGGRKENEESGRESSRAPSSLGEHSSLFLFLLFFFFPSDLGVLGVLGEIILVPSGSFWSWRENP